MTSRVPLEIGRERVIVCSPSDCEQLPEHASIGRVTDGAARFGEREAEPVKRAPGLENSA